MASAALGKPMTRALPFGRGMTLLLSPQRRILAWMLEVRFGLILISIDR
jgi:hypothetical protein